tara:strand:+ start:12687 stop:12932 length:246 start_codon:yes stop_codon:yes gene_type:complete
MAIIQEEHSITTNTTSKKKAAAFVNVTVVGKDGTSKKQLGGIPLYADNNLHKLVLDHLTGGGEINTEVGIHIVTDQIDFEL